MALAAALALTAALFHVLNHSLFKSLLFFGSGAVLSATGERDMEHLGGLIHRMPLTACAFLVGSAAISALPPLNGFVSEWLTFQAILVSPDVPQWSLKFLVPAVGAGLALSAALAAACFVKAFGITFLGRPRSAAAERAHEVDRFSLAAMFGLAGLCLLAGVFPGLVIDALSPVVMTLTGGARLPVQTTMPWLTVVPLSAGRSSYNGLLVLLFIAFSAAAAACVIHRFASQARAARAAVGLRLSRPEPDHPVHRRQLRPADPPRVRHARLPGARGGRHAAARRSAPGARCTCTSRTRSGRASTRRSRAPSGSPPTGSTTCSS